MSADLDELRRLRRARDRMDREFAQPLDVPALARTALMSPAHFSRRFREAYSETPYSYLMTRRIERAQALLRRGDYTVTEACFAVGCTSLGSFSARFTELVGETPSAYRARRPRRAAGGRDVPGDGADAASQSRAVSEKRPRPPPPSIAGMSISLSTVHILVDDPEAALGFYRDALGWTVANEVSNGEFSWITLVNESQPGLAIVLSQPHAGRSKEDGDALAALLAKGEIYPAHFRTDDLDANVRQGGRRAGRRGDPGARRAALGRPRRRRPRPGRQPAADRTGS